MLQQTMNLGIIDICCAAMIIESFRAIPREGHLTILKNICGYLNGYKESFITCKTKIPDYSMYKMVKYDWGEVYDNSVEELPQTYLHQENVFPPQIFWMPT